MSCTGRATREGTSAATLLATSDVRFDFADPFVLQTHEVDVAVPVTAGSVYTVRFNVPVSETAWIRSDNSNPYAGGRASNNANHDLVCQVWISDFDSGPVLEARSGVLALGSHGPDARLRVDAGELNGIDVVKDDGSDWGARFHNRQTEFVGGIKLTNAGFLRMTNALQDPGATYAQLDSTGTWTQASDRRLKADVEPFTGVLERVRALRPVSYRYRDQLVGQVPEKQLGFLAQELREELPALVADNGEYLALNYSGLGVVALAGLRELAAERRAELDALHADVAELRALRRELGDPAALRAELARLRDARAARD